MSKLQHDGIAKMSTKQKERHELCCAPVLSMSDSELDAYFTENLKSVRDTREFLKHLTKIVAALAKK